VHLLLVDNYDSFTWNLAQLFMECGARVTVRRNDAVTADALAQGTYDLLCISPGPRDPAHAGCSMEMIRAAAGHLPVFGVCLGMQAINEVFGGSTLRAPRPVHGMATPVHHTSTPLFAGIPDGFAAARYHSLMCAEVPDCLAVTARADDGVAMALEHRTLPIVGVQFHPESFLTAVGAQLVRNLFALCARAAEPGHEA
jgi:anthranilate synthase component 2